MCPFQKISNVYNYMISSEILNVKNDVISSKNWNVLTFKIKLDWVSFQKDFFTAFSSKRLMIYLRWDEKNADFNSYSVL